MITLLESENNTIKTKLKLTCNFRTYQEYDEDDDLQFSATIKEDKFIEDTKECLEYNPELLDSVSSIKADKVEVTYFDFEDESDFESGKLEMNVELSTDSNLSDSDIDYLVEGCFMQIDDYIDANVKGTVYYTQEYFDPYASDGRGEIDKEAYIDEYCHISSIPIDFSWERI